MKSQRPWCAGRAEDAYRTLVGKSLGKYSLGRPRRRWNDNIKHIREIDCDSGAGSGWNQLKIVSNGKLWHWRYRTFGFYSHKIRRKFHYA
jgi:hypothetical protein